MTSIHQEYQEFPQGEIFYPSHFDDALLTVSDLDTLEASWRLKGANFENEDENIDTLYETYLGEESQQPDFGNSCDLEDSHSSEAFQRLPIKQWDGEDCYDWASSICRYRGLESTEVSLWKFKSITGSTLLEHSLQEFCTISGRLYGSVLFQDFQKMRRNRKRVPSSPSNPTSSSSSSLFKPYSPTTPSSSTSSFSFPVSSYVNESWELSAAELQELDKYIPGDDNWSTMPEDLLNIDIQSLDNDKNLLW
ncbi:hypothetical protein SK128_013169 [Halocaridina rubra]|uniref:Uncharacterized protein n=1 Tax=Halocaridina rubra TaxID=373956 RepID=A0AAN8WQ83_HALRR